MTEGGREERLLGANWFGKLRRSVFTFGPANIGGSIVNLKLEEIKRFGKLWNMWPKYYALV